jgi:hypothetical protein
MRSICENRARASIGLAVAGLTAFVAAWFINTAVPDMAARSGIVVLGTVVPGILHAYWWVDRASRKTRVRLRLGASICYTVVFSRLTWDLKFPLDLGTDRRLFPLPELLANGMLVWVVLHVGILVVGAAADALMGRLRCFRREGLCVSCGYDLTGNVSGRCPECGAACEQAERTRARSG